MSRPSLRIRHRARLLPATIVAAAAALALTGCEPGVLAPPESQGPTPSASEQPVESPAATDAPATDDPAATDSPEVTTPPVAGELPCTDVFTAEQLYEFNPNFAPSSEQGSLPGAIADIAEAGGTVCAYQHVTGSDRLVVAVLQEAAGFAAPEFEAVGDEGVAALPSGGTIVAAASIYFTSAADAQPVLDAVADNLG